MTTISSSTDIPRTAETSIDNGSTTSTDALASQQVFLELLVAQIRNQNPLDPMDGMDFVTQLAQFSQLEQLTSIRSGIDQLLSVTDTSQDADAGSDPQT